MIFTYGSAPNKETNLDYPVRNHVRDESSGSDFCRSLNSHWCLWSEQLPLRAPRGVWDWGSQHWPPTITQSTQHLLQSHHTTAHCVCSINFNNTNWNAMNTFCFSLEPSDNQAGLGKEGGLGAVTYRGLRHARLLSDTPSGGSALPPTWQACLNSKNMCQIVKSESA